MFYIARLPSNHMNHFQSLRESLSCIPVFIFWKMILQIISENRQLFWMRNGNGMQYACLQIPVCDLWKLRQYYPHHIRSCMLDEIYYLFPFYIVLRAQNSHPGTVLLHTKTQQTRHPQAWVSQESPPWVLLSLCVDTFGLTEWLWIREIQEFADGLVDSWGGFFTSNTVYRIRYFNNCKLTSVFFRFFCGLESAL